MSAQLEAAAKEARKGNLDIKKQVRHIGNVFFSNCVEVSAQEAIYLALQIPLTKGTRVLYISIHVLQQSEYFYLNLNPSLMNFLLSRQTLNQIV